MIPAKNYFSGGLGKLKNIGGSRFFTTPHTVQVPAEYEISSGSQGEFIACSLDGRLWLFDDKLTVLKWNSSSLRMEITKSIEIGDVNFIARGIDWILTTNSFFQVLDDAPYIFSEQVSFNDNFSVDKFYSFLPEIDGWQIINNFLVRRSGNEDEASFRSLSIPASLYLTHLDDGIYGKDSSNIGTVSIEDYQLVISPDYSTGANVSGLAFLDKTLYGFKLKQDSSLCPMSADSLLYNSETGSWSNVFDGDDTSGNIFFDPFNYKALAVRDDAVNLLPEKKIFTARGISQWFAPTRKIESVTSDFTIAPLEHDILATHINSGLYREILHQKNLSLTCRGFSDYKLAVGKNENMLQFNKIAYKVKSLSMDVRLLNVFEKDSIDSYGLFFENQDDYSQVPVFYEADILYTGIDYFVEGGWNTPEEYTSSNYPGLRSWDEDGRGHHAIVSSAIASIFYIEPLTGIPVSKQVTINPEYHATHSTDEGNHISYVEIPDFICILDDNLVWGIAVYTYNPNYYRKYKLTWKYIPIFSRNNISALNYQSFTLIIYDDEKLARRDEVFTVNLQLTNLSIQDRKATFKNNNTNLLVVIDIPPDYFTNINNKWDKSLGSIDIEYQNYPNINNPNETLHVAILTYPTGTKIEYYSNGKPYTQNVYSYSFFVFKSQI